MYTDISLPASFPATDFRAFGNAASRFFPGAVSDEALFDSQERRQHFSLSWQAVRYRYRGCAECNEEFRALLGSASESWKAGWGDEELAYKLERCIYLFFTSGVSVFDSFVFCLYFLGHALRPNDFPDIANPRGITRKVTARAFSNTFQRASITRLLAGLPNDARFSNIDFVRNLVGHRISGRRSIRSSSTTHADGTYTMDWHEEAWYLPGAGGKPQLTFDDELLQRHLDDITGLLASLASAAREFAENPQAAKLQV